MAEKPTRFRDKDGEGALYITPCADGFVIDLHEQQRGWVRSQRIQATVALSVDSAIKLSNWLNITLRQRNLID